MVVVPECYSCKRYMEGPTNEGGPSIFWCRGCGQQVAVSVARVDQPDLPDLLTLEQEAPGRFTAAWPGRPEKITISRPVGSTGPWSVEMSRPGGVLPMRSAEASDLGTAIRTAGAMFRTTETSEAGACVN